MTTRNRIWRRALTMQQLEVRSVPAAVLLNEIYANPPGFDDNREFIEIRSIAGGVISLSGVSLVEINGDPLAMGVISNTRSLFGAATGNNGLLLLGQDYTVFGHPWGGLVSLDTTLWDFNATLGNNNLTVMLVENFTGLSGQDLDINDDGVLDVTPWTAVDDSVGWLDPSVPGGKSYSPAVLTQATNTPDAASRFPSTVTPNNTAAWYNGEMALAGGIPDMTTLYNPAIASKNLPAGAHITPGDVNFALTAPAKVAGISINAGTSQRSRVTSVAVTFDKVVTLPGAPETAFQLKRNSDNAVVALSAVVINGAATTVTLSFTAGPVEFGSLADGRYTLTALANQISTGDFDGNGDSIAGDNYVLASASTPNPPTNIFRLFGDSNGDGTVAANDFIQFRLALGGNNPIFDFDGDGAVAASDFIQFRLRFGGSI